MVWKLLYYTQDHKRKRWRTLFIETSEMLASGYGYCDVNFSFEFWRFARTAEIFKKKRCTETRNTDIDWNKYRPYIRTQVGKVLFVLACEVLLLFFQGCSGSKRKKENDFLKLLSWKQKRFSQRCGRIALSIPISHIVAETVHESQPTIRFVIWETPAVIGKQELHAPLNFSPKLGLS